MIYRLRINGTYTILAEQKALSGLSLIHAAVIRDAPNVTDYLLENGLAEVDERSTAHPEYRWYHCTPLFLACFLDMPSMAEFWISKGADVNVWIRYSGGFVSSLDPQWTCRWLHDGSLDAVSACAMFGTSGCLRALIDAGATVNVRNCFGRSTFQFAVGAASGQLVKECLECVEEDRQHEFVNEVNPITGDTPLMMACMHLEPEMVTLLLAKRADPNIRCFDSDNHGFLIEPYPFYSLFGHGAFNDKRPLSFRNLSALAFAAIGNNMKLRFAGKNAASLVEECRLKILNALVDAGATLGPCDSRALELAKGISSNERVVEWISCRLAP
jgi:hypothetical protein